MPGRWTGCALLALLASCGSLENPCPPPAHSNVVYVVERDWHTEIGIPVAELEGNLVFYRDVFPGAETIMFGYGKKTFFTAPPETISEYILGPVPGPAAIQAVGLSVLPTEAYKAEDTVTLALPPGGRRGLSDFIWKDLARDASGQPVTLSRSHDPDGLFYAAASEYNLFHTCNTWAADALHAAGLKVESDGIVFAAQLRTGIDDAAAAQCR